MWVVSGDYKRHPDGLAEPFEVVPCHCFITESTFGLPIYQWQQPHIIFEEMKQWWNENSKMGKPSLVSAYSLGKAQRLIYHLADAGIGPVYAHSTILKTNEVIQKWASIYQLSKAYPPNGKTKNGKVH